MSGYAGSDRLLGRGGDDTLIGGTGDDTLSGGSGSDVYLFALGDGHDFVVNHDLDELVQAWDIDVLRFGEGITPEDVQGGAVESDLVLTVLSTGESVRLSQWRNPAYSHVTRVEFHDGAVWDEATLNVLATNILSTDGNDYLAGSEEADSIFGLAGDDVLIGMGGDDLLNGGVGGDVYLFALGDGNDIIVDSVTDGALDFLGFEEGISREELSFELEPSGLRIRYDASSSVILQGWNPSIGETVIDYAAFLGNTVTFLSMDELLGAPLAGTAIADVSVLEDSPFAWSIPETAFHDPDATDHLIYSVTSADGGALPSWLSFDAPTQSLHGTPAEDQVGTTTLRINVTDRFGLSANTSFDLMVANVNDAPTGAVGVGGTAIQGQTLIASNTLADADGLGSIGYQWQSSADGSSWTDVAGATATSFTLGEAQAGKQMRVTASYADGHGKVEFVASNATAPVVGDVNHAPTIAAPIADQVAIKESAFTFRCRPGVSSTSISATSSATRPREVTALGCRRG
ncbi:MAG: putative Ig domain-containing protein [Sulfuritalea sp.]|nr:putative Ig domain-containing protein [Sulfuritalea sp.]